MKIAIIVDTLSVGGAERQAILCVSELRKLGHSADLIHYHAAVGYAPMLEKLGIKPIYIAAAGFPQRCRRLCRLFREQHYDVVHGFKMAAEVYAAVAGTWARVPRRFGSFRSVYTLSPKYRLLHHVVDKFLDGWVVNSKIGAESMAHRTRISRKKISVLHNGVSEEMFSNGKHSSQLKATLGLAEDTSVITTIARLEPEKNHRLLLEVAARVSAQEPQARFLIVGKGSLGSELQRLAAEKQLVGKVIFVGERSDVAEILAATDISALTTDLEGLPNAILEYMAAGRPIVCTKYPGYEELLTHESNALVSNCGEPQSFAENVIRLLRDAALRERLGKAGREFARRHFSNEAMARNLATIYAGSGRNGSRAHV